MWCRGPGPADKDEGDPPPDWDLRLSAPSTSTGRYECQPTDRTLLTLVRTRGHRRMTFARPCQLGFNIWDRVPAKRPPARGQLWRGCTTKDDKKKKQTANPGDISTFKRRGAKTDKFWGERHDLPSRGLPWTLVVVRLLGDLPAVTGFCGKVSGETEVEAWPRIQPQPTAIKQQQQQQQQQHGNYSVIVF